MFQPELVLKVDLTESTTMFAIIRTGGKQYKVAANDVILVERLEATLGSSYTFDTVLMVGNENETRVGTPFVKGAQVVATVENEQRSDKVIIFKKRRRHTYRRKKGHRQYQTVLRVVEISADGMKSVAPKAAPKAEKVTTPAAEASEKKATKVTDKGTAKASKAATKVASKATAKTDVE